MNSTARRHTIPVRIGNVTIGGNAPIVVQSMTNTDTADVEATTKQVAALARAGSELVRITVDRTEAAAAVPHIRERLDILGVEAPLIGDFHYNGHTLLAEYPACAQALAKYRINPGNVGFKEKRDKQFAEIVEIAARERQGGAHRRELGKPRPGSAHAADGRERARACAQGRARGHARGDRAVRASERRARDRAWARP